MFKREDPLLDTRLNLQDKRNEKPRAERKLEYRGDDEAGGVRENGDGGQLSYY